MRIRQLRPIIVLTLTLAGLTSAGRAQEANKVVSTPPVSVVEGTQVIKPAAGTGGKGVSYNFLPYNLPGQEVKDAGVANDPFIVSYANRNQPVQTSDWWTGIGLQWSTADQVSGWVIGRKPEEGESGRSQGFISEPFQMQFVDVGPGANGGNQVPGISSLVHGLRFWNQNRIVYRTDGKILAGDSFNPSNNFAGRGNNASERSPIVTVGLLNVHPLGAEVRTAAPWSNVKVQSYSDWGVVVSYADGGSELTATLANGSPFAWLERTAGAAPFVVWAGYRDVPDTGRTVWYNKNGVLGVTVTNAFVPENGVARTTSTAAYVIFADQGNWAEQAATSDSISMFTNPQATRVTVLAMPHNVDPRDAAALTAALTDLGKYACQKIVNTKLHYPLISGSDQSVTAGGQTLQLGFDEKRSVIRTKLEITTASFQVQTPAGSCGGVPLQVVFPHHRKAMIAASRQNILVANGAPQYVWNSVIGELHAYVGNSYVRELTNYGALPFLPGVAVNSNLQNPLQLGQLAVDDIYETMKTWFFIEEPVLPGKDRDGHDTPAHIDSFARNLGTYINVQTNTYIQGISGVYELLAIADQLARSPQLAGADPDVGKSKQAVAAEMRGVLLDALKELLGQWADVYTAQSFQYNSEYNSFLGYPEGFGSVQNFNDHHFHYSYFLRAAAAIGRYDRDWLTQYLPLINKIRRDVATYDRGDKNFPFLREFSPFYGHNWADGTGQNGQNQESVSEAMNFAYGLIELGQVLGDQQLRDLGIYMFEEEALAAEQYWFNQDADLAKSSGQFYNGNWPDALVHYTGPDGGAWKTTLAANVKQFGVFRNTFFGGIIGTYAIQQTPMSAFALFFGRNQAWLKETWQQYLLDSGGAPQGPYEVIIAGIQAQLPESGQTDKDVGLVPALKRLNQVHNFFPGSPNTLGKHWAYTLAQLGQVDTGVIADTTSYGVFSNKGQRTYVAYNPTGSDLTVTFTDRASGAQTSLQVPAFSVASKVPAGDDVVDRVTRYARDSRRLYLLAGNKLMTSPGGWMLPAGETPYPGDASALAPSLAVVPVRSDQNPNDPNNPKSTPISPPPASDIVSWTGTFSGKLTTTDNVFTRFALYTNQNLFPGWQQDNTHSSNNLTVRFIYDFDSDGRPDRIEVVQNAALNPGNSFVFQNKLTEYYVKPTYGPATLPPIYVDPQASQPFRSQVSNGTLTVQIYGGSNPNNPQFLHPVPVSQDASPLTNRASWVLPPYEEESDMPKLACVTICFAAPGYYLLHLDRLPHGSVYISGVNFNQPIDTGRKAAIRIALQGGSSAQDRFNQQFVAAQLSLLALPLRGDVAAESLLECYRLDFAPVILSGGVTLRPTSSVGFLLEAAREASRSGNVSDFEQLAGLLDLLNGDNPASRCGR